ncbi:hypothetical protein TWF569_007239 [Orbilia oligospora]|uniref:Uncharacterized protein n=1 Tax=Orbilia oligospora TaxID=2813651 RepID=A0A7C8N8F8_ORBOL|nr:hypothetical protein TWF102_009381 [Orbilia oligospora]KAF3099061.1 hypothetical protein TWF103_008835 [Orbilia oligospora]KAF3099062.1 hypothetical protein TWF103_008835 [Orbilia oligospora]KAF3129502.1 hypothetical protein TWF594_010967 [Orbilia oligospora]KAF3136716.1 hypothetical protein TWF703_005430 [Orbilia oligospora]
MKSFSLSQAVSILSLLNLGASTLLLDFDAQRGDNPSILGLLNLEQARGDSISANTKDLYIKLDKDPKGVQAAHVHRKAGYIRAEYHSLKDKTKEDTSYFIGYTFSLGTITHNLVVWQWKEYKNAAAQNVPLNLEFNNDVLELIYEAPGTNSKKVAKWGKKLQTGVTYRVGIVINTSTTDGALHFYWDGVRQTLNDNGTATKTLKGVFWAGQSDPKFGAYRGEETVIDTYIYKVQIGTKLDDIRDAAGIGSDPSPTTTLATVTTTAKPPTTTCSWEGHCIGAPCKDENDCSDDFVCKSGSCAKP